MKEFFAVLVVIFVLALAGCKDESENNSSNNADIIGTWTGNYGTDNKGELKLDIAEGAWILVFKDADSTMTTLNGTWTRNSNTLTLERGSLYTTATASLSEGKLILKQSWSTVNGRPGTCELKKGGSSETGGTTLKIKNQSFTEITDVIWNNVTFSNNQYENSIKMGTEVTSNVAIGSGYIFFKRKSNPITARTRDLIIVEKDQKIEFTFSDNTVIVEVNNPNNNGTLGSVQSTVVWWDDAEGEMQQYHLKQSFVGYYKGKSDLLPHYSGSDYFSPTKNGNKSIAVGGTNAALLHLKINLNKKAKLSFWYANKNFGTDGTIFLINGVQKAKWTTNIDWSFVTFDLESGENNIIWEKKDGYYFNVNYSYYYLSLDDILIYYTE
jgi:hypothetical protein